MSLALIVVAALAMTGGGGPPAAPPTPTPSPFDAFEASIPPARQATQQNPTSAQAWIDLGNVLYDSAQVVRESAPDSLIYQQRLGRWLEATSAYSQALALTPDNAGVRADMGASSCFYGAGTGDQSFVRDGTEQVRRAAQAAPNDERVLLSLGQCLISTQPPQTAEAIASWQQIIKLTPSSPLANSGAAADREVWRGAVAQSGRSSKSLRISTADASGKVVKIPPTQAVLNVLK